MSLAPVSLMSVGKLIKALDTLQAPLLQAAATDPPEPGPGARQLHAHLFRKPLWAHAVPFLLVLGPLTYNLLAFGLYTQDAVISGCEYGLFRDSGLSFGGATKVNTSLCVAANGESTSVAVPGYFDLGGGSTALHTYFFISTMVYVYLFAQIMVSFYLTSRLALRLLPHGIIIVCYKTKMLRVIAMIVVLLPALSFLEVVMQSLAYEVKLDTPLPLNRNNETGDAFFADSAISGFFDLTAGEYFSRSLPIWLQFTGLAAFCYGRFDDLYGDVSAKALLTDPRRADLMQHLSQVRYSVRYKDLLMAIAVWWVNKRLRERPGFGLRPGGPYGALQLVFYLRLRCSPGYFSTRRSHLEGCSEQDVHEVVRLLHAQGGVLAPLAGGEEAEKAVVEAAALKNLSEG